MSSSQPLNCVIIDDNEFNRLTLEHLVGMNESLTLLASLGDGIAALSGKQPARGFAAARH